MASGPRPYKVVCRHKYAGGKLGRQVYGPGFYSQVYSYPTLEGAIKKARFLVTAWRQRGYSWRVDRAEIWYGYPPPPARPPFYGQYTPAYYGEHSNAWPPALLLTFVAKSSATREAA